MNGTWRIAWYARQRRTIYLCALLLALSLGVLVSYGAQLWAAYAHHAAGAIPAYGDFFALWSFAQAMTTRAAADLYDPVVLRTFRVGLGMDPSSYYPFVYPPTFLPLIRLFALPYDWAYAVWIGGSLLVFVLAVRQLCTRHPFLLLMCAVAPASTGNFFAGQLGFLFGALLLIAARTAATRPILAGCAIGLLSMKPHLGLMVPIALAAAGLWRCFAVSCSVIVILAATATALFGWAVWPAWLAALPRFANQGAQSAKLLALQPTIAANLQIAGASHGLAIAAQAAAAVVAAVVVWRAARHGLDRQAASVLVVAAVVASPYSFYYDLPMVLAAMAMFVHDRLDRRMPFSTLEVAVLAAVTLVPAVMYSWPRALPVSAVCLMLLLWVVARRDWHPRGVGTS